MVKVIEMSSPITQLVEFAQMSVHFDHTKSDTMVHDQGRPHT